MRFLAKRNIIYSFLDSPHLRTLTARSTSATYFTFDVQYAT